MTDPGEPIDPPGDEQADIDVAAPAPAVSASSAARRARARRKRRTRRAAVVGALVLVWVAACAVLLLRARDDAANGLDSVSGAEKQANPGDLLSGKPSARLVDAKASFASARSRLKNPVLTPIRWVPVVGRQLRAATAMAGAATRVTDIGSDTVTEARAVLGGPHANGQERVVMLRRLGQIAATADRRMRSVSLGPKHALVGPLADKRADLEDKLARVRKALSDGSVVAAGLAGVFDGPRHYLVLAANNAEMRAGSGMFLSAGELQVTNGVMTLGEFRPTGELAIAPEKAPPINDADLAGRWGFLNPNREWRNLGLSPRFAASAQLAARMWPLVGGSVGGSAGGSPPGSAPDGVIVLDPVGLQLLMRATGAVDTPAGLITPEKVVDYLTHDQYAAIPPPSAKFDAAQAARREQLGLLAGRLVERLSGQPVDVAALASSLADAAHGRHLLAWSSRPDDGEVWRRAGVTGDLTDKSLVVSILNRGGNKLDHFLDVDSRLTLHPVANEEEAVLTLTLTNATPEGENVYVAGPYPGSGVGAGEYTGIVAVNLPAFAGAVTVDGFSTYSAAGPDGPTQVVAVPVVIGRDQAKTVTVRFRLPKRGDLHIEPAARVPGIHWSVPGQSWTDDRGRSLHWG
ncbi:MAG: hypothetical protein QOK43_3183 [Acidimicrobiaceae bacterium]|nr:hypothetical protein [Acidimicrobiaceae bacterium]